MIGRIRSGDESVVDDKSICEVVAHLYNVGGSTIERARADLVHMFTRRPDLLQQPVGWFAELMLSVLGLSADIVRALAKKCDDLSK